MRSSVVAAVVAGLALQGAARADSELHRASKSVARQLDCDRPDAQPSCALASRRVEITLPRDWRLSEDPPYPGILVAATHLGRGRGRLTLAYQEVRDDATARDYSEQNRRTLERIGFAVKRLAPHPSGAFVLEAVAPDRRTRIRQGYRVEDGVAYVLTLAAPASSYASYARAFDDTLRGLVFARTAPHPVVEEHPAREPAPEGGSGDQP